MNTDTHTSGSTVKKHISFKTGFGKQCNTEKIVPIVVPCLSTSSSSSSSFGTTPPTSSPPMTPSQTCLPQKIWHLQRRLIIQITLQQSCQVKVWIDKNGETRSSETSEELLNKPTKTPKPNKNENHEQVLGDQYHSDIPEWLQEFKENLVDDSVPEHRDSHASSSHELSLEPTSSADLGKHSVYTHFPKDRNCEICKRTKIPRAPCRRRIGRVVPRAE